MAERNQPRADTTISFVHDKQQGKKGQVRVDNAPGNYTIYFGDGKSSRGNPSGGKPVIHHHEWAKAGVYTAWLVVDGDTQPWAFGNYRVLETAFSPVTVAPADDRDYTARVTFTDAPASAAVGTYTMLFGNADERVDAIGEPGTWVDHYFPAGNHKIQVQDHWSGLKRVYDITITEPVYDPKFTLTEDTTDPDRYTVQLAVTNVTGTDRKLTVDWDDGTDPEEINASAGTTVSHRFDFAGDYVVSAAYTDDTTARYAAVVSVPFTAALATSSKKRTER